MWQAWHLMIWIVTLRGRRGAYGTGLALAARLVSHGAVTPRPFSWQAWHFSRHLPSLCVAGVALRDICLHFVWQAWHLTTSIVTLRGRRGTCRHFAWQARYVVVSVPSDDSWQRCAILIRLVVASLPGDDRCCLCIRFHG